MLKLPEETIVKIEVDNKPFVGAYFTVCVRMNDNKSDYWISYGPTNNTGTFLFTSSMVIKEADELKSFFMMDYNDIRQTNTLNYDIHAKTSEEIEAAIKAFDMFWKVYSFPKGYKENLLKYQQLLQDKKGLKGKLYIKDSRGRNDEEEFTVG